MPSVISFSTNGGTSSGTNNLAQFETRFGDSERTIVALFRDLYHREEPTFVYFRLALDGLTPAESKRLLKIQERLPGGKGKRLPSFSAAEYSMFTEDADAYEVGPEKMCKPYQLMKSKVPHSMTTLECADTFTSVLEAEVQHGESVRIANEESKAALELGKKGNHRCKLFCVDDFPVIAVHFGSVRQLGSTAYQAKHRLPRELFAKMKLNGKEFESYLMSEAVDLPHHQAFFVITSHPLSWFVDTLNWSLTHPIYKYEQQIDPRKDEGGGQCQPR